MIRRLACGFCFLLAGAAYADRGALSVEVLPGFTVADVRLPASLGSAGQVGTALSVNVASRFAITNNLEIGAVAFWEPSSNWVHAGASYQQFSGSLTSRSSRFGALVDARMVRGLVWRFHAGAGVGFSQRVFSQLDLYDVSSATPRSFGLQLANTTSNALVLAPTLGVRWTGDHVAVGVEPRFEVSVGDTVSWALTVPVALSWSWFP